MKPFVLLLAINARFSHSNLALFYMKQVLLEQGIPCKQKEQSIKDSVTSLLDAVLLTEERPDYLLLSLYIWNSTLTAEFLKELQKLAPEIRLILGGPEAGYNSSFWLKLCPQAVVLRGPGEPVLPKLIQKEWNPGLVISPGLELDEVPFPYSSEDLVLLKNRLVYYETSRGCPFGCSYCLSACEDQPLQFRDLDRVKGELKQLAFSGARVIKLVDRSFNADPARAREIWKFLLELDGPTPFHFEIHPLFLEEEDFPLLAQIPSRLFHFEIGVQTISDQEQKAVDRIGLWQDIRPRIERLIRETSIPLHLDQIVGLPGADADSVRRSFNGILSLKPDEFQMGFLKILPGTPLSEGAGTSMISSSRPPYQVLQTPDLSYGEFRYFQRIEELLNSFYNTGLFQHTMALLMGPDFPFREEPITLFEQLLKRKEFSGSVRFQQWAKLGEALWQFLAESFPAQKGRVKDVLRRDWAPHSQGQYLPGFLQFTDAGRIKNLRRSCWPLCEARGVSSAQYKRALLLELEDPDGKELMLSLPLEKGREEFWISLDSLELAD